MLKIKELREEKSWTQSELAKKINSTNKNIWAYENNIASPSIDTLIKLSQIFNVSIDYLVGRADDFGNVTVSGQESDRLPNDEQRLIHAYRRLDNLDKVKLIEDAEYYANKYGDSNKFGAIKK